MNLIDELIKLSEDPFSGGAVDPDRYVKVLTKAAAKIERLEKIVAAAQNLVKVKGRYHSEIAYQRLVDALKEDAA